MPQGRKAVFRGTTLVTLQNNKVALELQQVLSLLRGDRVSLLAENRVHETNSGSSLCSVRAVSQQPTAL